MITLLEFMVKSELSRKQKLDLMTDFNQSNEDTFMQFPNCAKCNPNKHIIWIENNNPVVKTMLIKFPNCAKCNSKDHVIAWEKII